jgi:hypothetical protein
MKYVNERIGGRYGKRKVGILKGKPKATTTGNISAKNTTWIGLG